MELWKVLGFTKAAVEVMLSGRDTEDIWAGSKFIFYAVCPFYICRSWRFLVKHPKKGGRKNE